MESSFKPGSMEEFLRILRLSHYTRLLEGQGYEHLGDLFVLSSKDLDNVHITDVGERTTILSAIDNIDITTWLTYYSLAKYEPYFTRKGIRTVGELKERQITDDTMDELEVMVPGHRKRLASAIAHLSSSQNDVESTVSLPRPLACGYWARNESIPTMKSELLWVNCKIKSNVPGRQPVELEFMVDTGSEVVTCTNDIVENLGLQFIQIIKSKGIHATEEKSIYRGTLILGNNELEVEVMPDDYNSVGCNVFRKFVHMIDDKSHFWFAHGVIRL